MMERRAMKGSPDWEGRGDWRALGLVLVGACALVSRTTRAAPERLAVHPLVVPEVTERGELEYRKLFQAEVARLQKNLANPASVRAFLSRVPHRTCVWSPDLNKCLAELAQNTKSKAALFVTLNLYPRVRLTGRVVHSTGDVRTSAENDYGKPAKKNPREMIRKLLHQFLLPDLKAGLPAVPPTATASVPQDNS